MQQNNRLISTNVSDELAHIVVVSIEFNIFRRKHVFDTKFYSRHSLFYFHSFFLFLLFWPFCSYLKIGFFVFRLDLLLRRAIRVTASYYLVQSCAQCPHRRGLQTEIFIHSSFRFSGWTTPLKLTFGNNKKKRFIWNRFVFLRFIDGERKRPTILLEFSFM